VLSDLKSSKTNADQLGNAFVSEAPQDKQRAAYSALSKIDQDIQYGIEAFSN
jgi:hypothetical protein